MLRSRWTILVLLAVSELLGMSLWFSASAVSPHFRDLWHLTSAQTAWLTTMVQLGFVAGTALAAFLNLADVLPARWYFATSALLAAAANAALLHCASYPLALTLRLLTGLFLAGVYPPAMKMIATWFQSARGFAIGTIVGALTLGKSMPYLLSAFDSLGSGDVITMSSAGAVLAALIVAATYSDGPFPFQRRAFSLSLVPEVFAHRETRLAIFGYLGHMWELYAMWSLVSLYFVEYFLHRGIPDPAAAAKAGFFAFTAIAAGCAGSILAGSWADRFGRERTTIHAMVVSGCCALIAGHLFNAPPWIVIALVLVWGFSVVADSAQFSAIVTEVAPKHAVGTALTIQTSLGFLLTAFAIQLTIDVHQRYGWAVAFSLLAIGPVLGILSMRRLRTLRS